MVKLSKGQVSQSSTVMVKKRILLETFIFSPHGAEANGSRRFGTAAACWFSITSPRTSSRISGYLGRPWCPILYICICLFPFFIFLAFYFCGRRNFVMLFFFFFFNLYLIFASLNIELYFFSTVKRFPEIF